MIVQKTCVAKACIAILTHLTHCLVGYEVAFKSLQVFEFFSAHITRWLCLIVMGLEVNIQRALSHRDVSGVAEESSPSCLSRAREWAH